MTVTQYGFHEKLVNRGQTNLNGGINDSVTTITVDDASALPSEGYFYIKIENELIRCYGTSSNDILVATRGAESTVAASHTDGTDVECVLTNEALQRYLLSTNRYCAAYTQEGATSVTGYSGYSGFPLNRSTNDNANITTSDLTWHNQGSATIADSAGGFVMTVPKETSWNLRGLSLTSGYPTTPFQMTARFRIAIAPSEPVSDNDSTVGGLWIRESSTGELLVALARSGQGQGMWHMTDWNTFGSTIDTTLEYHNCNAIWIRMLDDGSVHQTFFSMDGSNWTHYGTAWWQQSRTGDLATGGNQIGFFLSSASSFGGSNGQGGGNSGSGPATCTMSVECFHVEEL